MIQLHDLTKRRLSGYEAHGLKLLDACTDTILSACAKYGDDEGFLPDDRMLVMGSKVEEGVYEFILFDTTGDTRQ